MKTEEIFEKGSVWKAIAKMCIPVILVMLVTTAYNMADMLFVGRTGGANQVAAISLSSPLFMLLMTCGTLIGGGGCAIISRALGAKDMLLVKACSSACTVFAVVFGLLITAAVLLMPDTFVGLFGANEATWQYTKDYITIMAIGAPIVIFSNGFGNLLRADGDTVTAAVVVTLGSILNIALDPLFISTFRMGVRGAAIATVLSNVFTATYILIRSCRKSSVLTLNPLYALRSPHAFWLVFSLGVPSAASNLLGGFVGILSNNISMQYGADVVAAMGVGGKPCMIVAMIVMGLALGVQPMLAYNFGAGNTARIKETLKKTAVLIILVGTTLTALCFAFRRSIVGLFLQDPALMKLSCHVTVIGMLVMPVVGLNHLAVSYLQAVGFAGRASLLSVARQGLVFVPSLLLLHALFGMEGMFWAGTAADFVAVALSVYYLLRRPKSKTV
ncbi:MAG: MATE family efflux transporter [Clostridia bacterium]|nr:MATE family efflux transporter [Clostridia bacterium]